MKRSDMVKSLASQLIIDLPNGHNLPFDTAQDVASLLLFRLENEGMSPPYSSRQFNKNWDQYRHESLGGNFWDEEIGD